MLRRLLGGVAHRLTGYDAVRTAVGSLLLTAAGLKGYQLATGPVLGTGMLDSRWVLISAVELELLFGLWLLANIWPKPTWAAALACFSLFTCISLYKALSGYPTCGCFGRLPVNPWFTAALDFAAVLSLLRWRPAPCRPLCAVAEGCAREGRVDGAHSTSLLPFGKALSTGSWLFVLLTRPAIPVLLLWLAIGVPAVYAMEAYAEATLSDAGEIPGDGKTVVLRPETWIGKRFPLLPWVETDAALDRGQWTVILYRTGCDRCERLLRDYENGDTRFGVENVAFIALESFGDKPVRQVLRANTSGCTRGDYSWLVEAPLELRLNGGKVISVGHDAAPQD